jgi:hypothetical protein
MPDIVIDAYNPSTPETEAGGLQFGGQPRLHKQFQVSLGYKTLSQNKQNKKEEKYKFLINI